jgi:hypothetical protein
MRVEGLEKGEKKSRKAATSPYWGDETLGAVALNFGMFDDLRTFLNRAKSDFDRLRGLSVGRPLRIGLSR